MSNAIQKLKYFAVISMVTAAASLIFVLILAVSAGAPFKSILILVALWLSGAMFGDSWASRTRVTPLLESEARGIKLIEETLRQRDEAIEALDDLR
jgi:hypothetical protein